MVEFIYYGKPATAGSKRAIPYQRKHEHGGGLGVRVLHDNKRFRSFAAELKDMALNAANGAYFEEAVRLCVVVVRPRPKCHFRANGDLRSDAPAFPTNRPDTLKIVRAVEDSLTGVLWRDDSQVVEHALTKAWGDREAVVVRVEAKEV